MSLYMKISRVLIMKEVMEVKQFGGINSDVLEHNHVTNEDAWS